jgi:hypothetical protein
MRIEGSQAGLEKIALTPFVHRVIMTRLALTTLKLLEEKDVIAVRTADSVYLPMYVNAARAGQDSTARLQSAKQRPHSSSGVNS